MAQKKYIHPILKQIQRSKREKKISNDKIAEALFINKRTLYRRYKKPETFTLTEIEDLARLFNWRDGTLQKYLEVV
jgi:hypothetical protein